MLQHPVKVSATQSFKLLEAAAEALSLLPFEEAEALQVLPLSIEGNAVALALLRESGPARIDQLAHRWGKVIFPHYVDRPCLEASIADAYGRLFAKNANALDGEDAPAARYVHWLLEEAVKRAASDIHLEPVEDRLRIRLRVDGQLREYFSPPQRLRAALINRMKLMAGIPVTAQHVPAEGRISKAILGSVWDLRVSVLPAQGGEGVVVRLLSRDGLPEALSDLGFGPVTAGDMGRMLSMGHGLVLATGPTGSGKSTTLYTLLKRFDPKAHKIITIEDPIEYRLPGITQLGVREDMGITFAEGLRSILRQAPDILMIGEIRDAETARIALNASMTGHLVLSSLHTMDAASAVTRLMELGLEPFLLSSVLKGVVAQRLVRRLCKSCKEMHPVNDYEARVLEGVGMRAEVLFQEAGCSACQGTGFSGRMVVSECFRMKERFSLSIEQRPSLQALRETLRDLGVQSLFADGMNKVVRGETSLQEVLGVCVQV
ncbi:MAG TPA: type II secretion system protein GspE [Opitutae bacterium]|nr:type II secretion system protein GspE [Opitutae bacterium]|tara:strand:- start:753 stop:2219 length:1467 start_codon:yes stop_codon:yes gene_type:complete